MNTRACELIINKNRVGDGTGFQAYKKEGNLHNVYIFHASLFGYDELNIETEVGIIKYICLFTLKQ